MKKLFVLALLSFAFNAMAEDYFLYWMVDDNATLDGSSLVAGDYYAKIKTAGGDYLSLYTGPEYGSYGTEYGFNTDLNLPTFAGTWSDIPAGTTSFIVELYNSTDSAIGSWVGQATLSWNANNFATVGTGTPPSYATATAFQSIPEPTSGLLLLLGVAGLALRRKNKKA